MADDPTALELALQVIGEARARWPGIALDAQALASLLVEHVPEDSTRPALPAFAADLVLARACLGGNDTALRAFHREMFDRVDRVLARLGLAPADIDDVKQDVRAKLLLGDDAKLARYHGTGPLAHWVAAVAGREAIGARRRQRPTDALDDDDLLVDAADDPQLRALKARHRVDFKQAFHAAVADLAPRDRAILRTLIVDDRNVSELAALYGVHRVTASRWVTAIRDALLQGTRQRLQQRLDLDESSLDSAIRLLDSNLELSLYRLLA